MISEPLNSIFQKALDFARHHRHEYLTIEHVMLSLANSHEGTMILSSCGANVELIRESLGQYLLQTAQSLPQEMTQEPFETVALARLIDEMMRHVKSAQKHHADVGDFIAAVYDEQYTYACILLEEYGISRVDVLEVISHGDFETAMPAPQEEQSALSKYAIDLIIMAKEGKIDPVIGRVNEIERTIQTLCRRRKNNPLLIGEPGVGKTAIAEGLALRIVAAQVPKLLEDAQIFALDLGAMLAGTKYRGDFEKRLKMVMDEVKNHPNAILFIDEIHTIVGAGAVGGGSMDASNQLKPALASGAIRCMGATTHTEYRNVFEKDKALSRRFARVDVNEPSFEESFLILKGLREKYELHHEVKYTDKALRSAVELSKKYITDRFLPDVAIDLMDEAGASFHLATHKKTTVTPADIESVIAKMTGIPVAKMSGDDTLKLAGIQEELLRLVVGQDNAVQQVVRSIKRSYAGLSQPNKPISSFLFSGPTGVGKTELAKSLASSMGIHFERFDMSEYMEKHSISRLIGAPAGYVGFEQGGLLSEAIRKHPYTVLLLDEIEKAHPDVVNILLQVMDHATLTDNSGYKANFANIILIMTSNIGATERTVMGFNADSSISRNEALKSFFTPEFRNRLDAVVEFGPLPMSVVEKIVNKFIDELNLQLKNKKVSITVSQKAKGYLATMGYDKAMGARPLARVIQEKIKDPLADEVLFGQLKSGGKVAVDFTDGLVFEYYNSQH